MTVKQRIDEFIRFKGISTRAFEVKCGLSNGYFRQLRNSPTVDKMEIILSAFPELNRTWLTTGDGEMLNDDVNSFAMERNERVKAVVHWLISQKVVESQKELGEKLGITNKSYLSQLVNGRAKNVDFINKLSKLSDRINVEWIENGDGEMLTETLQSTVEQKNSSEKFRLVPLIHLDSVGGIHSLNSIESSEQYIIRMMPFNDALDGDFAILQSGNSMYPTIPSGSVLLIREVPNWKEFFGYGNVFVLLLKDGRRITKEVRRYDADPNNYVWCVSYNPDVADEELPRSMIRGVWKVIKYVADFGW